jgi:hypothetical protein
VIVVALATSLVTVAFLLWGYYNHRRGLKRGRELEKMEMLVALTEPEELLKMLREPGGGGGVGEVEEEEVIAENPTSPRSARG